MRVACIAASRIPSLSANSIRVMKVGQALTQLGHEVCLWVPEAGQEMPWESLARHYGLHVRFDLRRVPAWPPLRRWDFSVGAVRQSIRWAPDLWYVWPYQAAAALSLLGRPAPLEAPDRPPGAAGPSLFRLFLRGRGARRLLVITDALRVWLEVRYRRTLQPPFTLVTPSGVDLEAYAGLPSPAEARARLGWPAQLTVSYSGHLYEGRGLELMVELARRHPDFAFVWAGGEPEAVRSWRARVEGAKVHNLRLLGFVSQADLPMIHAASDVLLMPYARAIAVSSGGDTAAFASPMKAFEYLAAGRPILSSRLPVFLEVLHPGNAILLEAEDVEAWDAALARVAADSDLRTRLGTTARREAAQYSWLERTRRALEGLGPDALQDRR